MYTTFTAGGKDYELKLTTKAIIELEKKIKVNPLGIFGTDGKTIPTVETMVYILWASLQAYNHGISIEDTFEIFDSYLEDNSITDFILVIMDLYRNSGLVPKEEVNPKN